MPAEGPLARTLVAAGIATSVACGGLLAVVLALDVPPPPTTTRVLAALLAAGLVAATSGTLRPSVLVTNLRGGGGAAVVGTALGGLALAVAGPRLATAVGGTGRTISLLAPLAALALVAAVVTLARTERGGAGVQPLHRTAAVSAGLAAFLAASAATSVLELPDAYPLSRYPMYSSPRAEGYTLEQVAFTGVRDDGSQRALGGSLSRNALLRLVADEDLEALEGFARTEAERDEAVVEVVVELRTIAVTEHPDPPGFEVVSAEPVLSVTVP